MLCHILQNRKTWSDFYEKVGFFRKRYDLRQLLTGKTEIFLLNFHKFLFCMISCEKEILLLLRKDHTNMGGTLCREKLSYAASTPAV